MQMQAITTTEELAAVCARMVRHPYVTVDTEFLRETTYYPLLCVAQMASPQEAMVIDTLATGIDLGPFFELLIDENVVKVFHAARQDIEIVWNMAKKIPHPIFDSQVAAMVLGYGDSISYDALVQRITGDTLDKSHRFTDWTRRPLSDAQMSYALSDVTHLRDVYRKLGADLAINYKTEDFVAIAKKATDGKGVDLILDMVGGDYIERNFEAAAVEGRIVQIAFQGSPKATVDFRRIMLKRLHHTGSTLRSRSTADKAAIARAVEDKVLPLLADGRVKPVLYKTFPLKDAAAAHALMESSAHIGKIVLAV